MYIDHKLKDTQRFVLNLCISLLVIYLCTTNFQIFWVSISFFISYFTFLYDLKLLIQFCVFLSSGADNHWICRWCTQCWCSWVQCLPQESPYTGMNYGFLYLKGLLSCSQVFLLLSFFAHYNHVSCTPCILDESVDFALLITVNSFSLWNLVMLCTDYLLHWHVQYILELFLFSFLSSYSREGNSPVFWFKFLPEPMFPTIPPGLPLLPSAFISLFYSAVGLKYMIEPFDAWGCYVISFLCTIQYSVSLQSLVVIIMLCQFSCEGPLGLYSKLWNLPSTIKYQVILVFSRFAYNANM